MTQYTINHSRRFPTYQHYEKIIKSDLGTYLPYYAIPFQPTRNNRLNALEHCLGMGKLIDTCFGYSIFTDTGGDMLIAANFYDTAEVFGTFNDSNIIKQLERLVAKNIYPTALVDLENSQFIILFETIFEVMGTDEVELDLLRKSRYLSSDNTNFIISKGEEYLSGSNTDYVTTERIPINQKALKIFNQHKERQDSFIQKQFAEDAEIHLQAGKFIMGDLPYDAGPVPFVDTVKHLLLAHDGRGAKESGINISLRNDGLLLDLDQVTMENLNINGLYFRSNTNSEQPLTELYVSTITDSLIPLGYINGILPNSWNSEEWSFFLEPKVVSLLQFGGRTVSSFHIHLYLFKEMINHGK